MHLVGKDQKPGTVRQLVWLAVTPGGTVSAIDKNQLYIIVDVCRIINTAPFPKVELRLDFAKYLIHCITLFAQIVHKYRIVFLYDKCKENGIATWLTPAMNLHRNPLCGRNFEYYSEDPLVAGKFAAAKVQGIQSTNTAASVKHFVANNKETNRYYSDSRMSERALREIYLRGFEICVKESQPWTIMSSYNVLNGRRVCECFELIDGILRGEWDFDGMVITDWHGPCNQEHNIIAGNDVRMPIGYPDVLREAMRYGRIKRGNLEVCVKRILEMILKLD